MVVNIHTKNWQVNALEKLLKRNSLDAVVDYHMFNYVDNEEFRRKYNRNKTVRLKKCLWNIKLWLNYTPYWGGSCVCHMLEQTMVSFTVLLVMITMMYLGVFLCCVSSKIIESLSMCFHNIHLDMTLTNMSLPCFHKDFINRYILLLPEIDQNGYKTNEDTCSYYIIDSEWNKLNELKNIRKPKSVGSNYK